MRCRYQNDQHRPTPVGTSDQAPAPSVGGARQRKASLARWCRSSIALENRFLLGDKSFVCAAEVAGLHADRLCLRLGLNCFVNAHAPLLVHGFFGDAMCKGWTRGNACSQCLCGCEQLVGRMQSVEETPCEAFVS